MSSARASRAFVLPGGLPRDGELRRVACFVPITGALEERLRRIVSRAWSSPRKVTALLAEVTRVARSEQELDADDHGSALGVQGARELCVGDRQFLMVQLGRRLGGEVTWLHPACVACERTFDVPLARGELPVKAAGPTFPFAEVATTSGAIRVRAPTGGDQERVAGLHLADARRALAAACLVASEATANEPEADFDESVVRAIEAALDEVSPDVGTLLELQCPDCGQLQRLRYDPYDVGIRKGEALFAEVNTLALHYHWSEAEILALPSERRQLYLRLVEKSLGLHS